jgi:aminoglycoside N3'-acetyltransferase
MSDRDQRPPVSRAELVRQLRALGVQEGGVLLVHTRFSAVRPVEGGPEGLIVALGEALGPHGTLVMPSWTDDDDAVFDPATSRANPDLGVVPETFRRMPGVARGSHPFAFAATGPRAEHVVGGPLPMPPHIPESAVGRVHDLDGQVLLLGIGHDADTTLHLAEVMAGVAYGLPHHITVLRDGTPVRIDYLENDHCCQRFALADEWLRSSGLQREGAVGHAHARLARSRDIVRLAVERLRDDPFLFLHPRGAGCADCDEARASVPA